MFKLQEKLETEAEIAGEIYQVNLSFDNIMKLLDLKAFDTTFCN